MSMQRGRWGRLGGRWRVDTRRRHPDNVLHACENECMLRECENTSHEGTKGGAGRCASHASQARCEHRVAPATAVGTQGHAGAWAHAQRRTEGAASRVQGGGARRRRGKRERGRSYLDGRRERAVSGRRARAREREKWRGGLQKMKCGSASPGLRTTWAGGFGREGLTTGPMRGGSAGPPLGWPSEPARGKGGGYWVGSFPFLFLFLFTI